MPYEPPVSPIAIERACLEERLAKLETLAYPAPDTASAIALVECARALFNIYAELADLTGRH